MMEDLPPGGLCILTLVFTPVGGEPLDSCCCCCFGAADCAGGAGVGAGAAAG